MAGRSRSLTYPQGGASDISIHYLIYDNSWANKKQRRLGCRLFGNPTFPGIRWVAIEPQPNLRR
jgi:hypothetical protein